ncbi:MarR family transcriptional regulator [Actinoplanes cyaneus]|uniref:MarR family transcriptional regulator n=1 Tax=Actinoplanes cyaneus TaxID=52696 RepID=A0A919M322_9ACTN|nr:GNAT family N-acetyltransferase [Actinoplanes cyaneus]MCW2135881.1 Acetyltransferase (GNAT) family protein [Actinoplanes cyaneus]GID62753.1 MarR family transcriptional regulator [Actinoplanes cyaneus]
MDVAIRQLGQPGDVGWVVQAHGEVYAEEYGWDTSFEALVARIMADYAAEHDPAREAGWIAETDGRRAGSVLCVAGDEPGTAVLRVLLVHPSARGLGLGGRLVDECLAFAAGAGYERMRLWTTDPLTRARQVYLRRGFALIREEPQRAFGADLVGQTYLREFATAGQRLTRAAQSPGKAQTRGASRLPRVCDQLPLNPS